MTPKKHRVTFYSNFFSILPLRNYIATDLFGAIFFHHLFVVQPNLIKENFVC